jgi:Metallopeptidase family M24
MTPWPQILPVRQQDALITRCLRERFEHILPLAMREAGLDMWLIVCQEDNPDPVFKTMLPMNTWTPILQMLIFCDPGPGQPIERINLSMTDTGDLFQRPWSGRRSEEQWPLLAEIVTQRAPQRIGINIGQVNWAAGGLTHNLYQQLTRALPGDYAARLVSAEAACERWLMTLSDTELDLYPHLAALAHQIIAECFSDRQVLPGITTTDDLEWAYWQTCSDLGFEQAFKPYFRVIRAATEQARWGSDLKTIRRGDLLHCDVGFRHLRLNTDHQELAYVRRAGEDDAPTGLRRLLAENNRLQAIYQAEFQPGQTGNELLQRILARAREAGVPSPKVYSHNLGLYLHEPGPLIGLPWEQENCPGRGDVRLDYGSCFTMELSVEDRVPEWDQQSVRLPTEQDVTFTRQGCLPMDGVQTMFHLI